MSRYGIIGDVHGSAEALEAVLRALDRSSIDTLLSVGDVVGFNAAGNEVARRLGEAGAIGVAGNHDRIALGALGTEHCWYQVEHALERTTRAMDDRTRSYLAELPLTRRHGDGMLLFHGAADDVQRYTRSRAEIARNREIVSASHPDVRLCFFGHTHTPGVHVADDRGNVALLARSGTVEVRPGSRLWFINPGSVDAARREDARARFAIYDEDDGTVMLESVVYDKVASESRPRRDGYRVSAAAKLRHEIPRAARSVAGVALRRVARACLGSTRGR